MKKFKTIATAVMVASLCAASAGFFSVLSAEHKSRQDSSCGSACLITEKNLLISIYAQDDYMAWSKTERSEQKDILDEASEYISSQAERYGKSSGLILNDAALNYEFIYDGSAEDDPSGFEEAVYEYIASLDTDALMEQYGADGVCYAVFINDSGSSYARPYYYNKSDSRFDEVSFIYRDDEDDSPLPPQMIAKQILRLFGASDLSVAAPHEGISDEISEYFTDSDPDNLMSQTIIDDNDRHGICDFTAYQLGLTDKIPAEVLENEELIRAYPGAFEYRV